MPFASYVVQQQRKKYAMVSRMINGCRDLTRSAKRLLKKAYKDWLQKEHDSWQEAPGQTRRTKLQRINHDGAWEIFQCVYPIAKPNDQQHMLVPDAFTDPFPLEPSDPMDKRRGPYRSALMRKVAELMILHGITPSESANYGVYRKEVFADLSKARGIVRFSIYRRY